MRSPSSTPSPRGWREIDWRTWGPVAAILLLLPPAFVLLRVCFPPIGGPRIAPAPMPDDLAPQPEEGGGGEGGGSASCRGCHLEQYQAWSASSHARAEGELTDTLPWQEGLSKLGAETLRPLRTIGVAPVIQLLIPREGGRLQVSSMAYDPDKAEWFDVFGEERAEGDWGHWTGGGMNWNAQCAGCHSTGVDKGWSEATQSYRTTAAEHGVGCQACHGALPAHQGPIGRPEVTLETCAGCHSRRADLTGAFVPGERFLDHYAPQLVDGTETFWPDGQVREEDFEWTSFVGSEMHAAGVTCTSCHDPHSGSLKAQGDALCLGCHEAMPGWQPHDPHKDSALAGCVGCHMPVTTYMQRDARHDHGFLVPDPWTAVNFGLPDACTRCHTDRDARWALAQSERWWGARAPASRARTVALARGRRGDLAAVPGLIEALRSEDIAAWRAAAAGTLEAFVDRDDVQGALIAALKDKDPLVRFAAAGSLGAVAPLPAVSQALLPLLKDPVRSVRVSAARALRFSLSPGDPRAAEYAAYLALASDTPTGLLERGTWAIERGDTASAVRDLGRAVQMDGRSAGLREAYAVALAGYGRPQDAAQQLREAVKLAPEDAGLWFRLGLGEAGAGDLAAAEAALARATTLQPEDARAWYNLGLVRQQLGQPKEAVAALQRAVALDGGAEIRYALASTLFNQGRKQEARAEALAVLALAPGHQGALQIQAQTAP